MTRRFWTEAELELVRLHYADSLTADLAAALGRPVSSVHHVARKLGLAKSREVIAELARQRTAAPTHPSHQFRFQPGQVPVNKGKKMPDGWAPGRMAEGQFKPGTVSHNWKPVGTEVVIDGYLHRKVSEAPGPKHMRWFMVHRLVWEAANGPVPAGHVVVFREGRRTTDPERITLDAVELVTRAELMRRNTIHRYGSEIASAMQLRASLKRQINRAAERAAENEQEASHG